MIQNLGHTNNKTMEQSDIKIHKRAATRQSKKNRLLNSSTPMSIGQQLRFIRKARGLSVTNVEDEFEISRYVITNIESDKGTSSINSLISYASTLGCVIIIAPVPAFGTVTKEKVLSKPSVNPFQLKLTVQEDDCD
jgi:transcriptional regulator with XRE-family HTH domain